MKTSAPLRQRRYILSEAKKLEICTQKRCEISFNWYFSLSDDQYINSYHWLWISSTFGSLLGYLKFHCKSADTVILLFFIYWSKSHISWFFYILWPHICSQKVKVTYHVKKDTYFCLNSAILCKKVYFTTMSHMK